MRFRMLVVLLTALLLVPAAASARTVDGKAKVKVPLLSDVARDLDKAGIDVLHSWRSHEALLKRDPASQRPMVAPLLEYGEGLHATPARKGPRWDRIRIEVARLGWMKDFDRGVAGALAAVKRSGQGDVFQKRWNLADRSLRVFLSFTKEDLAKAQQVRAALERQGYEVFIYLNGEGATRYSAKEVGRLFAEAGQHFVLETKHATKSLGVRYEARIREVVERRAARLASRVRAEKAAALARAEAARAAVAARRAAVRRFAFKYNRPAAVIEAVERLPTAMQDKLVAGKVTLKNIRPNGDAVIDLGHSAGRKNIYLAGTRYELLPSGVY